MRFRGVGTNSRYGAIAVGVASTHLLGTAAEVTGLMLLLEALIRRVFRFPFFRYLIP